MCIKKIANTAMGGMGIFASCAFAQDTHQTGRTAWNPDSWIGRESLFLDHASEKTIKNSGFLPSLRWTGEVWSNVSNASDMHAIADSLFTLEIEQDLSVLAEAEGLGMVGISAFYYAQTSNGSLRGFNSSQGSFSNIAAGEMARIFEIYYANSFETSAGNIAFRIGQLAADEDFMGMEYSDVFLNSSFGAIPNVAPGQLFSQYNVATPGLVIYCANGCFDATFGAYNGNIAQDISSNNGFDYSNLFGTVALWYQLGYSYEIGRLGGRIIFGGNYHSSPGEINFDAIDAGSFYSFYLGIQQTIANDSGGNALFGVYARIGIVPDSNASDNNFYADFGFNWFDPLPCRSGDTFAVGFSIIENERAARSEYAHYDGALEITYKCQITPNISLQPDFQIFLNQGERNSPKAAYIAGARLEVNF